MLCYLVFVFLLVPPGSAFQELGEPGGGGLLLKNSPLQIAGRV